MVSRRVLPSLLLAALMLPPAEVRALERVDLRVLRAPGALELVLDGMGPRPEIQKRATPEGWTIEVVTDRPGQLNGGARFLNLQEAGIDTVGLDGGDRSWRLQVNGRGLGSPLVTADGTSVRLRFAAQPVPRLTSGSYDLTTPGRVPQDSFVPPLRRRAVAPPLGDQAIGSIAMRTNRLQLPGAGRLRRLRLRDASARDVLTTLARIGGYNIVYFDKITTGQGPASAAPQNPSGVNRSGAGITVDFQNESIENAVNMVLMLGGLQARLMDRNIIVGPKLPTFARQLTTRTVRLNQVSPARAADFLMSQGATFYRTKILDEKKLAVQSTDALVQSSSAGSAGGGSNASSTQSSSSASSVGPSTELTGKDVSIQAVEAPDDKSGSLPLRGLTISPDDRLFSMTLTGEPNLVAVAEAYLKQLDLRKRQVAVRVQIVDVDLTNDKSIDNSFAIRTANTFVVSRNGQMLVNFGSLKPPSTQAAGLPSSYTGAEGTSPLVGAGAFRLPGGEQTFVDLPDQEVPFTGMPTRYPYTRQRTNIFNRPGFGPFADPAQPGVTSYTPSRPEVIVTATGTREYQAPDTYTTETPKNFQYPQNQFFDFVSARIESSTAKILADPTLVVQEGEGASVGVGSTVTTRIDSTQAAQVGVVNCTQIKEGAGLKVDVVVPRIDDNGFVSMELNPVLKVPVRPQVTSCNGVPYVLNDLVVRELKTGQFRVRDGQSLILTGVIQDSIVDTVTKWPVLGDLPLIGQFFRQSSAIRDKRELVIVVTPRIIDDSDGGSYGYGYQPSAQEAKQVLYQR